MYILSGGVDSSLVSAICAAELKKKGEQLVTYSFDFTGNDQYFKSNSFQPSQDRPYVEQMVEFLGSEHHFWNVVTKHRQTFYMLQLMHMTCHVWRM